VISDIHTQRYHSLNRIGARIWLAIETNSTLNKALESLSTERDVESEKLKQYFYELLDNLTAEGLK
jgi:hypothetical protein